MKRILIFFLFINSSIFSNNITIQNLTLNDINFVYKNCFNDNISIIIKPNTEYNIKIDSVLTLPIQVYFPRNGNLFYSVFCLNSDTLKLQPQKNNDFLIESSNQKEIDLFNFLNKETSFFSDILSLNVGYNYNNPDIERHYKKCQLIEKKAQFFIDSLIYIKDVREEIKKIITYKIKINVLGTYFTPFYEFGENVALHKIPDYYIKDVINRIIFLEATPPNYRQYSLLASFNYARFLNYIGYEGMNRKQIFQTSLLKLSSFIREQAMFYTIKFKSKALDKNLLSQFEKLNPDKRYIYYLKSHLEKEERLKNIDFKTISLDTLISQRNTRLSIPEAILQTKSKLYYIDFWATWCKPCIEEIPISITLSKNYLPEDISFIYLSIDENIIKWQHKIELLKLPLQNYILLNADMSIVKNKIDLTSIPRFIILDSNGIMIDSNALHPSDPQIVEYFNELLSKYR